MGINRIKKVLTDKLSGSKINLEFSFTGDMYEISYDYWNKIEQFAMELSTNSIKYSRCEKIYFKIDVLNKMIKFQFKDDGIGTEKFEKGYGISKIEEDLANCGKLIIDTSQGFDVIILFNK